MRSLSGLGVALFIVCLVADVGYVLAVLKLSGEPVGTVRHEGGEVPATAALTLDPAMTPLRAGLDVSYSQTLGSARLYADVTLRGPAGEEVWTRRLRVSRAGRGGAGGRSTASTPVERFAVTEAGVYRLSVRLENDVGGTIHSAEVDVRRNVRLVNGRLAGGIGAVGLLGLGVAVVAGSMRKRGRPGRPQR